MNTTDDLLRRALARESVDLGPIRMQALTPGDVIEAELVAPGGETALALLEVMPPVAGSAEPDCVHLFVLSARPHPDVARSTATASPHPGPPSQPNLSRPQGGRPPPIPPDAEARRAVRADVELAIDFASEHNFFTGLTQNISTGGLFIATHQLRRSGAQIRLRFTLPGEPRPIDAQAVIMWVRDHLGEGPGHPQGFGVRFVALPADAAAAIHRFMKGREPFFYDLD